MRRMACGYVCLDIYPQHDFVSIGGETANFAIGTARAGTSITFVGKIGPDPIGHALRNTLEHQGVSTCMKVEPDETAYCVVVIDGIERRFPVSSKGPYVQFPLDPADLSPLDEPVAIHLDFASVHLLNQLHGQKEIFTSADFRRNWLMTFPVLADVTFVSIGPDESADELFTQIRDRIGKSLLILTQGAKGSWAWHQGRIIHQPAPKIEVIDSTGAGDAYQAGFMLEYLKTGDIKDSMALGTEWGVRACQKLGASLGEIEIAESLKRDRLEFARKRLKM